MTIKKIYRAFRILLMIAVCVIGITYVSVRFWLGYRFQDVVKDRNYPALVEQFRSTEDLPEEVHQAYSKVFGNGETISTESLMRRIPIHLVFGNLNKSRENCPCFVLNYRFATSFWDRLTVGLQLDYDVGREKCLEYYLNNLDFDFNQIGIRNAAQFYFEKPLDDLSEYQLLQLCVMTQNPYYKNPFTHPENIERELKKLNLFKQTN